MSLKSNLIREGGDEKQVKCTCGASKNGLEMNNNSNSSNQKVNGVKNENFYQSYCGKSSTRKRSHFKIKKCCSILWIALFSILLVVSLFATYIIWFTDVFNDALRKQIIISKDSNILDMWTNPPVKPTLKIYFFNYTNIDQYLSGDDSIIKLDEVGPYIYHQTMNKYDVKFQDSFVTYRENVTYEYDPDKSAPLSDQNIIKMPNIPTVVAKSHFQGYINKMAMGVFSRIVGTADFTSQTVHDILFDYKDFLVLLSDMCGSIETCASQLGAVKKFGILELTKEIFKEPKTVHTGNGDLKKMGQVYAYRDKRLMSEWPTKECNKISGSNGMQFPPNLVSNRKKLELFVPFYCRSLPLVFEKEAKAFGEFPAVRYMFANETFSASHPSNKCYCNGECPPDGIFNPKPCTKGFSVFVSYPHFYKADPELMEPFEGLAPEKEKHESYMDLNERFGFPMNAIQRFQFNLQMKKSDFNGIKRDLYVPILWMELSLEDVPEFVKSDFYKSTILIDYVEMSLKILSILIVIISLITLYFNIHYYIKHFKLKEFKNFYIVNKN